MAVVARRFMTTDTEQLVLNVPVSVGSPGDITADFTDVVVAPFAGRIVDVVLSAGENGADATNPLNMDLDVSINGTTALTTLPKLDKTAGTGQKDTASSGTGITQAVVNTAANTVAKGDLLLLTFNITRTASPGTEMANIAGLLLLQENADRDFSSATAIT